MRFRIALELPPPFTMTLAGLMLVAIATGASSARADDDPGLRFGLVGLVGGGIAGVVHPGPLPGFIGYTDAGVEVLGEIRPWGGFLRFDYLSSGDDGRWTALSFGAGTEYRLFGDLRHTALFLRGGVAYERWTGNDAGCPIDLFVPNSCDLLGAQRPAFDVTTNLVGLITGVRVELPIEAAYVAFSANFVPSVAVSGNNPSGTFQLRFDLEAGFRDSHARPMVVRTPDEYRARPGGRRSDANQ